MMISSFSAGLKEKESGQAIILGAVSLLVLAVGIMTTAQLGWAIKERIQLQHAADNAAYSTATMVARSLNFIAWTNRAMVSQYVTAMAFQSYISYFDGLNMLIAAVAATLLSAAFTLGVVGTILKAFVFTAPVGIAMHSLAKILGKAGQGVEKAADGVQNVLNVVDKIVAPIVNVVGILNEYGSYWLMQQILGKGYIYANFINAGLGGAGFYKEAMEGTALTPKDKETSVEINGGTSGTIYDGLSNIVGGVGYASLFDSGSVKAGKSEEDYAVRAETLMTHIVNASREGRTEDMTWESKREFGLGTALEAGLSLIGGGLDNFDAVWDFLDNLFAKSEGGTILARKVDNQNAIGKGKFDFKKYENDSDIKDNPLFKQYAYEEFAPRGSALISGQFIRPPGGSIGGLIGRALNLLAAGGEVIPQPKLVGIQSTRNASNRQHCRYAGIVMYEVNEINTSKQCDDACSSAAEQCSNQCNEECPEYKKDENGAIVMDSNGNPVCATETQWSEKPGTSVAEEEKIDCGSCGQSKTDEDGDCEAAKSCREAMAQAEEELEKAKEEVGNAVENAVSGAFGGRPAQVSVDCFQEDFHRFSGVTPYVSFNIKDYYKNQTNHKEVYPTFLAAAHKMPSFMKKGALGFGDNYTKGNNFQMTSIGTVEGVGAAPVGECEEGLNFECSDDGYNFNYMNNDQGVEFLGTPGFHAWARSQVYYHRTGTWAEPPNLFNPYWKAKLSPIAPLATNTLENFGNKFGKVGEFLGGLAKDVVETVISH